MWPDCLTAETTKFRPKLSLVDKRVILTTFTEVQHSSSALVVRETVVRLATYLARLLPQLLLVIFPSVLCFPIRRFTPSILTQPAPKKAQKHIRRSRSSLPRLRPHSLLTTRPFLLFLSFRLFSCPCVHSLTFGSKHADKRRKT